MSKSALARGTARGPRGDGIVAHSVALSAMTIAFAGFACGSAASPPPVGDEDAAERVVTLDVECGPGTALSNDDAAQDPGGACTPSTPAPPTKCLAMDVRDGEEGCNAGQHGWFYTGDGCALVECCSGTQCSRHSLTDTQAECEERHLDCQSWQAGELASACVGLEAWSPRFCEGASEPKYAWNGTICSHVGCECRGRDCDKMSDGLYECVTLNQVCDASTPLREPCIQQSPAPAPSSPQLDTARAECNADGGVDCDAPDFIGSEAALCIARAAGLPSGLYPAETGLAYNYGTKRIHWGASATLVNEGIRGASGSSVSIEARTGIVIERLGWVATP